VRGEQSEEIQLLRDECDRERLDELHALVRLLGSADSSVIDQGDKVTYGLVPPSRCANVAALRGSPRPPTGPRDKLEALRTKLADSKAQLLAGDYADSVTTADAARVLGEELHYDPYVSAALEIRAVALSSAGSYSDARATFLDEVGAAIRGRRPDLEARGAIGIAGVEGLPTGNSDNAQMWLKLADAVATQVGTDHQLEMLRASTEGVVAAKLGDKRRALAAHEAALVAARQVYGADSLALWGPEMNYAIALGEAAEFAAALPHYERAVALRERSVGKDHPDVALVLTNLGVCYSRLGKLDEARATFARALTIRERIYGPTSPALLVTLNNNADFLNKAGDVPGALAMIERARAIADKVLGPNHPLSHIIETTQAEILVAAGHRDEARTAFDALIAREAKLASPELSETQTSRAALAVLEHDWATAADLDTRALAALEVSSGKDSADLVKTLTGLGQADIGLGKPADARPLLERAIAIGERAKLAAGDLADARAALAGLKPGP
jgi:tetratricopeptide (TPR) repeat protein